MSATKLGDITLTKQTGTTLTLNTNKKYVNNDVFFDIDVQSGAGSVTVASTNADIASDSSERNISSVIGAKDTSVPSTGYYIKVDSSGTGSCTITTAGWLNTGSLGTASATNSFYFPIAAGTVSVNGSNTVTPSVSISGSNATLSNTNNGISISAIGGGTASASVSAGSIAAGFIPNNTTLANTQIAAQNTTTSANIYISGVTIPIPSSGTNLFTVTLPNGEGDTITLEFEVDSNGNSNVFSDDINNTRLTATLISGEDYMLESEA